ncbi:MAG: GNAT family N-acetyltransferase [Blastocatellia bacterium]|nr:GNAT family N-acetyltransferase [Blastocatellia bacterium]
MLHDKLWLMIRKNTPIIRQATTVDAGLLTELGSKTFYDTFIEANDPKDIESYLSEAFSLDKQLEEICDPLTTVLIAEVETRAVGYAKLQAGVAPDTVSGTKPIEISRIYVLKEYLGQGIGQSLMQSCIDRGKSQGYETIWLGVWEQNRRAIAFYQRWGFRVVGEHIFQLGSDPQMDLLMERTRL